MPVPAEPPVEIVHSPLSRTASTAEAIAAAISVAEPGIAAVPVRAEPGFLEIGQGEWEGLHRHRHRGALRRRRWRPGGVGPWETVAPGGESLADVAARVGPALATTLATLAPRTRGRARSTGPMSPATATPPRTHPWSIVVGHDGVFKVALLTLFGLPLERFWMWSMDLCGITRRGVPRRPRRSCAPTT